jgi:hypothetical protein
MVGPLLFVPYWAYSNDNWYLLFGILFSWFASYTTFSPRLRSFIFLFTMLCVGVWFKTGFSIHQYITFFFFCSLGGYLLAQIAEQYDQEGKRGTLENDEEMMQHLKSNPNYLTEQMTKWKEENPEREMTFGVIDALARGREIKESDYEGTTTKDIAEKVMNDYYKKNPKALEDKITKWKTQNPNAEITNDIIKELKKTR